MRRFTKPLALALVSWRIMASNASASITIDTVAVGNPANASDSTGYGAVSYVYHIGTTEVTLTQYCAFLNAVAAADTYSLYNPNMAGNANVAGITRSGVSGSFTYSVAGSGARPVTYVSWFDAARFVNWLQKGQPTGGQNASTTEQGAYTLNGAMSGIITMNGDAQFGLPTESEWYKAAYYQPASQGGPGGNYWMYPTRSNVQPNSRNGSGIDPNSANFYYNDGIANGYSGGYAVNNSTLLPTGSALTDAGAFSLASSFYGTYDQGGNVWEWNDAIIGSARGLRGGDWADGGPNLAKSSRSSSSPTTESANVGFRIKTLPPVINCPADITVPASVTGGAVVSFTVTASGGCSPPPTVVANPPSGSTFPIGVTTVSCTASDACGNSANCSFQVTVTWPPIRLTCPSNITVTTTNPSGAVVFYTNSASGGCSPPPTINGNPPSGSTFPIGVTAVICTASDECGNSTNGSFQVTVTWPPILLSCPSNITVTASGPGGAVVNYVVAATGGCAVPSVSANPPSGSTFPIGTTTVTCTASDTCGASTNGGFTVTVNPPARVVPEYFAPADLLPPAKSVYISTGQWFAMFAPGIIIRDARLRAFSPNFPPPPLGTSQTHSSTSAVEFELSTDNGLTFHPASGTANATMRLTHSLDSDGTSFFDTEMLQLDLAGGTLPDEMLLRESPTLASTGKASRRAVPGGYLTGSFFDVFLEVSLDGGASWQPAPQAGHIELRSDPAAVRPVAEPTALLPPPNGMYWHSSPWFALYAQGIVLKATQLKLFTGSFPPPTPGTTNTHSFSLQADLQVSTDGGATFQYARAAAPVQVTVAGTGSGNSGFYDTEMLALNLTLPGSIIVLIRESPTQPSRGATQITPQPDGTYQISSFFDIFTELSLDGGASWSPATNGPARLEPATPAPEASELTPDLPPPLGQYLSSAVQWFALYANGVILSNVTHHSFAPTQPPPPGGSQIEVFGSTLDGLISMNGGASFFPFFAPADVSVQVNSRADLDTGNTRFFDTEMLSLNLSGGTLLPGIMVRESPTQVSLGRTSVRQNAVDGTYRVSSFFDVFTEISMDGGQTWSPSVTAPGTLALPGPPIAITCPANMTLTASGLGGAVVFYTVTASGGCSPPPTLVANPPSGSTFPVGTTTVTATASDTCGNSAACSFQVIVNPPPTLPLLTVTFNPQLSTINISWPSPSTGWTLQENTNSVSSANWTDHPFPQDNGTIKYIVVTPPVGSRFYRLKQ